MQEALPYKTWQQFPQQPFPNRSSSPPNSITKSSPTHNGSILKSPVGDVKAMVSENAVIVVGKRGCCMSHVAKCLLQGLGVNPAVYEIEESDEDGVVRELETAIGGSGGGGGDDDQGGREILFPAVFIGGELFGGLDRIMATHITGELIPVLKQAGALWL